MRTEKSIKNAIVAIASNIILILVGFISQAVFKTYLGQDYLGLNGLFTSIVSMLGIVELGLGTALIYHLYKPVAENDIPKIVALMRFYKLSYRIIAGIIILAGALLMPLLHFFVSTDLNINLYYIFGLFVIESAFSYLLSYKRSILYANQENYIVNIIHIIYVIGMNLVQIILLIKTRDYILYLWLKVAFRMIENVLVTIAANKRYPYIKSKEI
ncbi:MAG TPA: polysaccharide transporter, partial [Tissierellia bacterium]|nr:polysaccharide transporter [Tissierellia bacterium]